jgi:hypothetical protein
MGFHKMPILIIIVMAFLVIACEPADNRRIYEIFDSGEIIECTFIEILPHEMTNFSRYEVALSYQRNSIMLRAMESEGVLIITRDGTIETLDEERHEIIYSHAKENGCDYIINEDMTYDRIMRDRLNPGPIGQMFGGIIFITDERMTLSAFEREYSDKQYFSCRARIPDERFEIEGNVCNTDMFMELLKE